MIHSEIHIDSAFNTSIINNLKVDIYHRLSCWAYLVHYFFTLYNNTPKNCNLQGSVKIWKGWPNLQINVIKIERKNIMYVKSNFESNKMLTNSESINQFRWLLHIYLNYKNLLFIDASDENEIYSLNLDNLEDGLKYFSMNFTIFYF